MNTPWRSFVVVLFAVLVYWSSKTRPQSSSLPRISHTGEFTLSADEFIPPPGKFVRLSHGITHFTDDSPSPLDDPNNIAVLVHGLHDSVSHWNLLKKALLGAGYRVITYDNYGNGWSEAPNAVYSESLYVSQLSELLFSMNISCPVHLIGQSLGGAVVSAFAAVYPARVRSLTAMCPAGLGVNKPFIAYLSDLPVISDFIHAFFTSSILLSRIDAGFAEPKYEAVKDYVLKMMKYQLAYNKDLLRVLSRILADFPLTNMRHVYSSMTHQAYPVHIIWGGKDLTTPVGNADILKTFIPRAEVTIFPELGHSAHMQDPPAVSAAILEKLRKYSPVLSHRSSNIRK